jgi:hypothetical protein
MPANVPMTLIMQTGIKKSRDKDDYGLSGRFPYLIEVYALVRADFVNAARKHFIYTAIFVHYKDIIIGVHNILLAIGE